MSWVIEGKLHAFDGAGVVFMPPCSRGCQALHEIQKEEGKAAASWRAATALILARRTPACKMNSPDSGSFKRLFCQFTPHMASASHRNSVTTTDWHRGENVIPRSSAPPIYTPMLFVCSRVPIFRLPLVRKCKVDYIHLSAFHIKNLAVHCFVGRHATSVRHAKAARTVRNVRTEMF